MMAVLRRAPTPALAADTFDKDFWVLLLLLRLINLKRFFELFKIKLINLLKMKYSKIHVNGAPGIERPGNQEPDVRDRNRLILLL